MIVVKILFKVEAFVPYAVELRYKVHDAVVLSSSVNLNMKLGVLSFVAELFVGEFSVITGGI